MNLSDVKPNVVCSLPSCLLIGMEKVDCHCEVRAQVKQKNKNVQTLRMQEMMMADGVSE